MADVGAYLCKVTGVALICSAAAKLVPARGVGAILRTATGIVMILVIVSPWVGAEFSQLYTDYEQYIIAGDAAAQEGKNAAVEAMRSSIQSSLEAYILEKAEALGVDIQVRVQLSDGDLPAPCGVVLTGPISPYAKTALQEVLEGTLGISKEAQVWIS